MHQYTTLFALSSDCCSMTFYISSKWRAFNILNSSCITIMSTVDNRSLFHLIYQFPDNGLSKNGQTQTKVGQSTEHLSLSNDVIITSSMRIKIMKRHKKIAILLSLVLVVSVFIFCEYLIYSLVLWNVSPMFFFMICLLGLRKQSGFA